MATGRLDDRQDPRSPTPMSCREMVVRIALVYLLVLAAIWLAVLALAPVARGHSAEEIEVWETVWDGELAAAGELTIHLALERADWELRHPWYYQPEVHHSPQIASDGQQSGGGQSSASHGAGTAQWAGLVAAHFPAGEVDTALCIMGHESGGNPNADNPRSSARGLMQVLASLWAPYYGISYDALYDPDTNLRIARLIWDQSGWAAWSPWQRGLCH